MIKWLIFFVAALFQGMGLLLIGLILAYALLELTFTVRMLVLLIGGVVAVVLSYQVWIRYGENRKKNLR